MSCQLENESYDASSAVGNLLRIIIEESLAHFPAKVIGIHNFSFRLIKVASYLYR